MQQAYSAIRIISEAQTVRIVLSTQPGELMLKELCAACASFGAPGSEGIKAVVLDFARAEHEEHEDAASHARHISHAPAHAERTYRAIRAVAQPVLAVARDILSPAACGLLAAADFTLVNTDATLTIASAKRDDGGKEDEVSKEGEEGEEGDEVETLQGTQAARLGYVMWAVKAADLNREMERILNMLREKSAAALRMAKAGARLGQVEQAEQMKQTSPLETLRRINILYLAEVMQTEDAAEGLRAFLEKRKPNWKNR
jgi:enoyl-CoA hydratase/carnithine racemase